MEILPYDPAASTAETRAVAEKLVAVLQGEGEGFNLFDGTAIWVAGSYWWSGMLDPDKAARVQTHFHRCLQGGADGLTNSLRSIIADGNKAAIEMLMHGIWKDGRTFTKDIHIAIDVADGHIVNYREYGFDDAFFALEAEEPLW
ncbi:nuclear transport factor 2 family protein [Sphingosinicella microcystinivorans]|uniref:nuclear transport factor 2 family protein n=1 Tax=Sphingosinicella microcystinivorans TaxID=335406 RepID=UPI0022F38A20|nr:hypothetical protein [Sphingosinicella microcystinivorans]WBX84172.1 hypothetical protein PE061_20725 [Sphingosinicella microcystinivorans]